MNDPAQHLYSLFVRLNALGFNYSIHANLGNCSGKKTARVGFRVVLCEPDKSMAGFEAPTLVEAIEKALANEPR